MSEHTPGPWTHYDDTSPAGKTGRHEIVAVGRTVARIYYGDAQGEADARLIAATPDLLAALRDALFLLFLYSKQKDPHWDGSATDTSAIGRARAAIAKATGE